MVAAGAQGSEQELGTVAQYLSTHFAAEVQKPLDLNTAPAVELESVAGLLRKEAAALIAHREKNGPCKKLEDLKNVSGLDYKKIEARKTRLTCFNCKRHEVAHDVLRYATSETCVAPPLSTRRGSIECAYDHCFSRPPCCFQEPVPWRPLTS